MGAEQQLLWGVGMVQEELLDDTREDGNQPERDRRRKKKEKRNHWENGVARFQQRHLSSFFNSSRARGSR